MAVSEQAEQLARSAVDFGILAEADVAAEAVGAQPEMRGLAADTIGRRVEQLLLTGQLERARSGL